VSEHADHVCDHTPHCNRCGASITDPKAMAGVLFVILDSPIMPEPSAPFTLCFDCGSELGVWLLPEIAEDPNYQFARTISDGMKETNDG
jgi:hypothetical protein